MDPKNKINKSWKKKGVVATYEEARIRADELLAEDAQTLVKIKRCGPGGTQFKIKMWHPDYDKPKKKGNKKEKK